MDSSRQTRAATRCRLGAATCALALSCAAALAPQPRNAALQRREALHSGAAAALASFAAPAFALDASAAIAVERSGFAPVSYTHLTLPTKA